MKNCMNCRWTLCNSHIYDKNTCDKYICDIAECNIPITEGPKERGKTILVIGHGRVNYMREILKKFGRKR